MAIGYQEAEEIEIYENGNLPISMLNAVKFQTDLLPFQIRIYFELNELINCKTNINDRMMLNIYFEWKI